MMTDVNQIYYGDHFAIDTNIKSLHCIPETNIMLYANYKKQKRKQTSQLKTGQKM